MRNRKPWALAAICVAALAASACAGTKWVTTWTEPAAAGLAPLKKILVIGMSADVANRRIFEDSLVASLKGGKVEATPSYSVLPEGKISEDELRAKVKEGGYDGVILTRLISMDEKTEYVPPSTTAGVSYGWGPYWSGYGGWYGSVYSPGYLVNTTIVRLQTRLWSAAGEGKPVWTGVSESTDPKEIKSFSRDVSYMVVKDLSRNKLI
jgi:hypothetical protein